MKSWWRHLKGIFVTALRLRPHMRGGRYLAAAIVATSVCAAMLESLGVSLLAPLLSYLMSPYMGPGQVAAPMRPIRWLQDWLPGRSSAFYVLIFCGLILSAIVCKNLFYVCSQFLAAKFKRRVSINLRDALYRRVHGAELHLFEQRSAGEMATVFLTEMQRTLFTVDYLVLLTQRGSIALFYFLALLIISWPLTLLTVLLAIVIGALIALFYRQLSRSGRELSELNQKIGMFLVETFGGIRVIRTTHSEAREIERFNELSRAHARVEEISMRTNSLLLPVAETIAVGGALIIIGAAYVFFLQPRLMSPSYFLIFGVILLRLLPLLNQIYGLQGHVFYLSNAAREVQKWLELPHYPQRQFGQVPFTGIRRAIQFDRVGYIYPNGTEALAELSFEIPAGGIVALVGASGSGKSTVATLLLRLRQPTTGAIRVDDRDFWEFSAESWHRAVAVVEQEAFLFHDTLARNVAYGYLEATPEAVRAAIKVAHLEDVVESLPHGLDTAVGERGTMLSGGQRQRLAIARALVRNPQILILDEATSALDSVSEQQVQAALEDAQRDRTVLIIAHRFSTIQRAHRIVVLSGGRVAEQGTWQELVERRAVFWTLLNAAGKNLV